MITLDQIIESSVDDMIKNRGLKLTDHGRIELIQYVKRRLTYAAIALVQDHELEDFTKRYAPSDTTS